MATKRQPAANRQNATPEGRAAVHLNGLTHGFTGKLEIGSALHPTPSDPPRTEIIKTNPRILA
jgi:hypothetical protein